MLPFCSILPEHHHAVILKFNHFQHFIWKCESVFVKKYITFQSLRLFHLAVFSFQVKVRKTSKYYQDLYLSIISKHLFCFQIKLYFFLQVLPDCKCLEDMTQFCSTNYKFQFGHASRNKITQYSSFRTFLISHAAVFVSSRITQRSFPILRVEERCVTRQKRLRGSTFQALHSSFVLCARVPSRIMGRMQIGITQQTAGNGGKRFSGVSDC